jgi:signal transduction histidine kinase
MQFRTKIVGFAVLLALGAAICATLTIGLARGIDRGMQSVTAAEDQLALYLSMETNIGDLFRLYVTTAASPGPGMIVRLDETKAAVRGNIDTIRDLVAAERPGGDAGSPGELGTLDEIGDILDEVDTAFARVLRDRSGPQPVDVLVEPLNVAVAALDERLSPLVDLAVAEEVAKVIRARSHIEALSQRSVRLGLAAGGLTVLAAIIGVVMLLRAFIRPFDALLEGASRLAQGDLGYRIAERQHDEWGRLSRDFNVMAMQLERSDKALRAEEEELQRRVAARTAELEEANGRLADQDATRRRFLADVSHELRTPLTVMRGEAEVALRARDVPIGDGPREALVSIVEQSEHMSRLVDDLLFVARREAGEAPLALTRVAVGALVRRAVADAGQLAAGAVIVLRGEPAALDAVVEVDPGRLHQLIMVLLDNALRYSRDDAEVEVEVGMHRRDARLSITVRDRGIGIPAQDLPVIFDRFVRGSNALPGGTGLGLPVAKAIAEAHGGTLAIESVENAGTCVTLTLDIAENGGAA